MGFSGKPELTDLEPISNDGFWTELSMADFMGQYRIPAEYDNGVIKQGLIIAVVRVNNRLIPVKSIINELAPGKDFNQYLTDNPNSEVNGVDWAIHEYKHAVYCKAKAFLLQQFNTLNRRKDAENEAKEAPQTEQYWENEAQQAMFNLLNRYNTTFAITANADTYIGLI